MDREKLVNIFKSKIDRHNEIEKARALAIDYGTSYFTKDPYTGDK